MRGRAGGAPQHRTLKGAPPLPAACGLRWALPNVPANLRPSGGARGLVPGRGGPCAPTGRREGRGRVQRGNGHGAGSDAERAHCVRVAACALDLPLERAWRATVSKVYARQRTQAASAAALRVDGARGAGARSLVKAVKALSVSLRRQHTPALLQPRSAPPSFRTPRRLRSRRPRLRPAYPSGLEHLLDGLRQPQSRLTCKIAAVKNLFDVAGLAALAGSRGTRPWRRWARRFTAPWRRALAQPAAPCPRRAARRPSGAIEVAVVSAHLSALALNGELRALVFPFAFPRARRVTVARAGAVPG